jgi:RNA polymerase sigma factor (sigma-70 family)
MLPFFIALNSLDPEERDEIGRIYEMTYRTLPSLLSQYLNISYEQKPELVDDLTQDVYLKVIQYKERFIGQSEQVIFGNLTMMAKNVCYNYLKHNGLIQFSSLDEFSENDEGEPNELNITDDIDILGDLIHTEIIEKIVVAIDNLGSPVRDLLVDRFYSEMPYAEIAKKYNVKIGSVSTLIGRNLEKMRKELESYVENNNG